MTLKMVPPIQSIPHQCIREVGHTYTILHLLLHYNRAPLIMNSILNISYLPKIQPVALKLAGLAWLQRLKGPVFHSTGNWSHCSSEVTLNLTQVSAIEIALEICGVLCWNTGLKWFLMTQEILNSQNMLINTT